MNNQEAFVFGKLVSTLESLMANPNILNAIGSQELNINKKLVEEAKGHMAKSKKHHLILAPCDD